MADDTNWLSPAEWKWAQHHLPIACVDVLPVERDSAGQVLRLGLIARSTPHQGEGRWCLVGGRLRRGESFSAAIARQLHETLGPAVQFHIPQHPQPDTVAQYFPEPIAGELLDPRQHAVALVFAIAIAGEIDPVGEAVDFRWFTPNALPPAHAWGFGQDAVAHRCLRGSV